MSVERPCIRPVDPWDEEEMDVLQAQYAESARAEVPDARVYSRADSVALLRRQEGGVFYHAFAAFEDPDGTEMVGQTWVVGSTIDNLHLAHLWAWVPPRFGRRGYGAALVAHAEQHVRELGRSTAVTQTWIGDGTGGYRPFAERLGYSLAQTQVERRQHLPVDETTLSGLEADAAAHSAGYPLRTVVGPIPDELVPGFLDLYNLMNVEMPTGDIELEEGRRTPEVQAQQEDELRDQGRTRLTVLAYSPAGEAVAYSNVVSGASDSDDPGIDQWATIVRPDHRGHRVGLAVKCALTRAIQEHFPDAEYVRTQNAETNAPMVAINEALGFRVHSIEGEFQKRLDAH
ncbi:MAG: GNAT family N-acetyltransferase [Nocardioides sp.]